MTAGSRRDEPDLVPASVVADTTAWLERAVIGLNLAGIPVKNMAASNFDSWMQLVTFVRWQRLLHRHLHEQARDLIKHVRVIRSPLLERAGKGENGLSVAATDQLQELLDLLAIDGSQHGSSSRLGRATTTESQ